MSFVIVLIDYFGFGLKTLSCKTVLYILLLLSWAQPPRSVIGVKYPSWTDASVSVSHQA